MTYSVGEIARIADVTRRTLHHYDEIGLLRPTGRSASGYREYSDADIDRLQRILFYKELGFSLDTIASILDDPTTSPAEQLAAQRHLVLGRIERLEALVAAIDRTLEAQRMGYELTAEDKLEIFGNWQPPAAYFEELAAYRSEGAAGEFGSTESWTVPQSRDGWIAMESHRAEVAERMREAIEAGVAADSEDGMAVAEAERGQKTHHQQLLIAEWYARKPDYFGFIARPHEQVPGMPEWFRDAVRANAERAEA